MTEEQFRAQRIVAQYAFAMYDALLYLDAYPCNEEARKYYFEMKEKMEAAKEEYEENFGPLTASSNVNRDDWQWTESAWPWQISEGGCNRCGRM